jgi:hypothetical protein
MVAGWMRGMPAVSGAGLAHLRRLTLPAPPPHVSRTNERTVLQKLTLTRGMTLHQLYPAGRIVITNMVAKGWIELQPDGRTYCRTPLGEATMKVILIKK